MAITIKYGDSIFLSIADSAGVGGRAAVGGYELEFRFSIGVSARADVGQAELLTLFARASVGELTLGWLIPNFRATLSSAETHAELPLQLVLRLGPEQMEALARQQWPPVLKLGFVGMASGRLGIKEVFGNGQISASREDWDKALAACGYADTVNVWVRIPRSFPEPLRKAGAMLARAQEDTRNTGSADAAVGKCRIALENARPGDGTLSMRVLLNNQPARADGLTFAQRVELVRSAVYRLTSQALHEGAPPYGPAEARLAIALTAALLEYRGAQLGS